MRYTKMLIALFLIFLLSMDAVLASGGRREGTAGATELLIPAGARGIALAGAVSAAGSYGVNGIFWNPANLSRMNGSMDVTFSHMNYIADIGVEYGAIGFQAGSFGTLGLSIKALSVGDINKTTVANPDGTGQTFAPQFMVFGLSYSKLLNDRISVGFTLNYISESIDLVSLDTWGFNAGVTYTDLANVNGLGLAVVVENIGPDAAFSGSGFNVDAQQTDVSRDTEIYQIVPAKFSLPTVFKIGLSYNLPLTEEHNFLFVGQFSNPNYDADTYNVGVEYGWDNLLFLRGGYSYMADVKDDFDVFGPAFGFGLNYDAGSVKLLIDYAFKSVSNLPGESANHVFTIGLVL